VLLPCACALCGQVQDEVVCAGCAADLLAPSARCPGCGLPAATGGSAHRCADCRASPLPFDAVLTLGHYAPPQDSLVLALKFGGALPLADWIAAQLARRLTLAGLPPPALLVPVPLAPRRLAARGFNQAWEITRPLARRLGGVPADPVLLARRRETAAQSALDLDARRRNMLDAFALSTPSRLDGLHIGLVDDVMTSGATLGAAARTLKAHGAARVTAIVALRTP